MVMDRFLVAALYHFVALDDFELLQESIDTICRKEEVKGTLLLAREGINGTISGPEQGVRNVLSFLRDDPRLAALKHKESWAEESPFLRLKVRLKKEIVTMGIPEVDPTDVVGTYVKPEQWNALISDPDVVVVDTRNTYEVAIGTFEGAIQPETRSFREFPAWARASDAVQGKKKVAMFCTGGIRCEKATSLMLQEGVEEVYHLEGGILKYLEEVPKEESLWQGECFVFDSRVSVDHDLNRGSYEMCFGCRHPITEEEMASPLFEQGVCCPHCHDQLTDDQKERFGERQKQLRLAAERNQSHFCQDFTEKDSSDLTG